MSDFETLTGGCQCGTVRFEVRAPATDLYHCHCSMCRKVHGVAYATYAVAPKPAVVITQGEANLSRFDSSQEVHRYFCRTCGCQITIEVDSAPDSRWFMPGTLDGGNQQDDTTDDSGCSCDVNSNSGSPLAFLLLGLAPLALRRRRR